MGHRPGFTRRGFGLGVVGALLLSACSSDPKPVVTALAPSDFVAASTQPPPPAPAHQPRTVTADQAREGVQPTTTSVGAPIPADARPASKPDVKPSPVAAAPAGPASASDLRPVPMWSSGGLEVPSARQPVLVDAKVGDVNNRAIYASAFLRDLEAELTNKARDIKASNPSGFRREWAEQAERIIRQKLESTITEEILRAEAYASLSTEQKAGFRNFIEKLQGDYIRQNYGSRTLTEETVQSNSGMSLDQLVKRREQRELVMYEISREVDRKIQVPYRDIEMYYERQYKRYNPAPKAVFRMIRVPKSKPTDAQAVRTALEGGQAFEIVAASPLNTFKPKDAGLLDPLKFEGNYAEASLFSDLALNTAARILTPGTWTGPVTFAGDETWLYLQEIQSYGQSLYDAQIDIEDTLKSDRKADEIGRYILQLRERASGKQGAQMSVDEMVVRLVDIARERCLEPVAREGGAPKK